MFALHDPLDDTLRAELAEYDDLTAALLARRGVTSKQAAEHFLNPSYDEHLHDPLLMTDMARAAERLARAIQSGEKIAVWSDYDCDGGPGAVLMHDFLQKTGATFENYIPHRHLEGYGVNEMGVEKLAKNGVTLMVTVDSGITDVEPIRRANELGVEVIVTDHHLPGEALPAAYAVVNPNARADEGYPFRGLCGSGVAWKLCCATLAIAPSLREKVGQGWEKWLLDMAGLATIADMVPLSGENRVIATYGLKVLRKSPRVGLAKLCAAARINQRFITEEDIAFMIAPRVNAASRMGDAYDVLHLFTTQDETEAETIAKRLEKANRERRAAAGAITRAVHTKLAGRTVRSVIALGDPEWRPALLGLVANGISEEYGRPVFLWGREGNMKVKGSVRSGGNVHALDLMSAAGETFVEFGGHAASGGFTLAPEAIYDFEDRLVAALDRLVADAAPEADGALRADALINPEDVTLDLLHTLTRLSPFGMGNEKPVFCIRDATVAGVARFGKGSEHLRLAFAREQGELGAIAFFVKGGLARRAASLTPGCRTTVYAHLERDTFTRGQPVRLRLLDLVI